MQNHNDFVFYHIYTFSLAGAPFANDGGGTAHRTGRIARWIPHIRSLGCNAVLLSPALESMSHGYDVTDYFRVDSRLGTNGEFRALVDEFHANGVAVVLDSVFNHCGRGFFAFRELQGGKREYADWFSGVDFGRGSPLGDPFTYDTWSGHYELVKFNLNNNDARNHLLDAARFWIDEFGIDGMRLDAANVLDFGFMHDLRKAVSEKKPDFWLMGEVVGGDYARWVRPDLLHSVTNYILYKSLFSSHNDNNLFELAHAVQNAVPDGGLPLYNFLDNHDQPRIASNVANPAHLRTLYALLFTLPGIPSIYYGSEWGITGVKESGSDQGLRPCLDIDNLPSDIPWLADYIRKLADIRGQCKALRYGAYRQLYLEYHRPFVFERSCEDERVFTAINIAEQEDAVSLGEGCGEAVMDLLSNERFDANEPIPIAPCTARILCQG